MSTTDLVKTIKVFPTHSKDLNMVFAATYSQYKINVKLINTLLLLNTVLKSGISTCLSALNKPMYEGIMKGLDTANKSMNKVMPKNLNMDVQVGVVGDLLAVACTDFFGSIPENLFNIFQDIKNSINEFANFPLRSGLMNSLASELLSLKDQILSSLLGSAFEIVLAPIIAYEDFLKEHGLNEMLNRMERIERCLTKPGVGNRPISDFMHVDLNGNKQLYSQYYRSQLLMDSKGRISIKYLDVDNETKARFHNIMKSSQSYRITISG